MKRYLFAVLAAVAVFLGLAASDMAMAQTANTNANIPSLFFGYNPATGLNVTNGIQVAGGNLPTLSTTTTSCGTYATVNASIVGGGAALQVTANATTCTLLFTMPSAAPNGYNCVVQDETTPADTVKQSAHTTTSCTVTGTVVSGDKLLIDIQGF